MARFVLLPGAGGAAAYWHRVGPLLRGADHEVTAVSFPGADPTAGLARYTEIAVDAVGGEASAILVAQSMGAFTAAMVCARTPVRGLVLVNPMIPVPDETPGAFWANTGTNLAQSEAAREGGYSATFDLDTWFLHDVPTDVAAAVRSDAQPESAAAFGERCQFERWPDVPIWVLIGRDDRFFPRAFQERLVRDRLAGAASVAVDVIPGGHLVALSQPDAVAAKLLSFASALALVVLLAGLPGCLSARAARQSAAAPRAARRRATAPTRRPRRRRPLPALRAPPRPRLRQAPPMRACPRSAPRR